MGKQYVEAPPLARAIMDAAFRRVFLYIDGMISTPPKKE
jgi:hypothetical protein